MLNMTRSESEERKITNCLESTFGQRDNEPVSAHVSTQLPFLNRHASRKLPMSEPTERLQFN